MAFNFKDFEGLKDFLPNQQTSCYKYCMEYTYRNI